MATAPPSHAAAGGGQAGNRTGRPDEPAGQAQRKAARLAEMVAELTGCRPGGALHAVREHDADDALEIVAHAMVVVDQPPPFREPVFVSASRAAEVPLVHHASLRRWDRLHDEHDRLEDSVALDLRDRA